MICDDDALDALVICVYTLVDGSRVIGEEIDYNYANGLIEVYGVMEFLERDFKTRLVPYVPENMDTTFIFHERNVISRSDATINLKRNYFATLVLYQKALEEHTKKINDAIDDLFNPSSPLDTGGFDNFSRN
jgi:hypothetical protein